MLYTIRCDLDRFTEYSEVLTNQVGVDDVNKPVTRSLPTFTDADTLYVAKNGNDSNAGTYASPKLTIQNAINNSTGSKYNIVLINNSYTGELTWEEQLTNDNAYPVYIYAHNLTQTGNKPCKIIYPSAHNFNRLRLTISTLSSPHAQIVVEGSYCFAFATIDNNKSLYYSSNTHDFTLSDTDRIRYCVKYYNNNYFQGVNDGSGNVILTSSTAGSGTWTAINIAGATKCYNMFEYNSILYALTDIGVYQSTDGSSFTFLHNNIVAPIDCMVQANNKIYYIAGYNIYSTADIFSTSKKINNDNILYKQLFVVNNTIIASKYNFGIDKIDDEVVSTLDTGVTGIDRKQIISVIQHMQSIYILNSFSELYEADSLDFVNVKQIKASTDAPSSADEEPIQNTNSVLSFKNSFYFLTYDYGYYNCYVREFHRSLLRSSNSSNSISTNGICIDGNTKADTLTHCGVGSFNYSDISGFRDYLSNSSTALPFSSVIHDCYGGFKLSEYDDQDINNCLFYYITDKAIDITAIGWYGRIWKNTFYSCKYGIHGYLNSSFSVYQNCFSNNTHDLYNIDTTQTNAYENVYQNAYNANIASTNIRTYPKFKELTADFRLMTKENTNIEVGKPISFNSVGKLINGTDDAGCYVVTRTLVSDDYMQSYEFEYDPSSYDIEFVKDNVSKYVSSAGVPYFSYKPLQKKLKLNWTDKTMADKKQFYKIRNILETTESIRLYSRVRDGVVRNLLYEEYNLSQCSSFDATVLTMTVTCASDTFVRNELKNKVVEIYYNTVWYKYKVRQHKYNTSTGKEEFTLTDYENYCATFSTTFASIKIEFSEVKAISESVASTQMFYFDEAGEQQIYTGYSLEFQEV